MNPRGKSNEKLQEVLDLLGLSADEKLAAKAFYMGEAGQKEPQFAFSDLSAVAPDPVEKLAKELVRKNSMEELARLFLLVFSRGQSTCYRMFTEDQLKLLSKADGMDTAKLAAVYSVKAGLEPYPSVSLMTAVFDVAKHSTKSIRQAVEYEKSSGNNGKLILLATYFRVEYQNRKPYLNGGRPQPVTEAEPEDIPLLSAYEAIAVKCFAELYFGCVSQPVTEALLQELDDDLENDRMPEKLLPLMGAAPNVGDRQHKLTAGLCYWNYMLSKKLKNIVKFCLAIDVKRTLETMRVMSAGISIDVSQKGGEYDEIFGIKPEIYLRWAVEKNFTNIMKKQYEMHPDCYLKMMKKTDPEYSSRMLSVLKQQDPERHKKIIHEKLLRAKYGSNLDREKIIDAIVPANDVHMDVAKTYLRGGSTVETLYPYAERWKQPFSYAGGRERLHVSDYMQMYADEEFFRRCEAYMLIKQAAAFFSMTGFVSHEKRGEVVDPEKVAKMFADFAAEGVGIAYQLAGCFMIYNRLYQGKLQDSFLDVAVNIFAGCLKDKREETLAAFAAGDAVGRYFALRVLRRNAQENKKEILAYSQDSTKIVTQELFDILCAQRGWEEEVKGLLSAKKAAEKKLGIKVLAAWQKAGADFRECFMQAYEKEKNVKIRELLEDAAGHGESSAAAPVRSREELVKELHKGGRKRVLAWAYETPFSPVHMAADDMEKMPDGAVNRAEEDKKKDTREETAPGMAEGAKDGTAEKGAETTAPNSGGYNGERAVADEEYLQAVLLCYASKEAFSSKGASAANNVSKSGAAGASADGCGVSANAAFLARGLDEAEFAVYVNELFDKWLSAGAEAKKRWVLYAAAIHGGSVIIDKLYQQIKEWPQNARGAIACEAVRALSLNPLPQALLIVDGIARKFKFKQVRAAAGEALEFAAAQLGITREELEDRIVPDFGFDENVERVVDYGERKFIVTLTPALEIEVFEAELVRSENEMRTENSEAGKFEGDDKVRSSENKMPTENSKEGSLRAVRGKKLKNLPAPGKKDDAKKAAEAYEEFKQMKKQMKAAVSGQRQRLEMALSAAREWSVDAWKQLFVKNPLMHQFATALIWGVYEKGKLKESFRYMEDGSFNTKEEEEFELQKEAKIGLVHPVELTEEERTAWKEQLEDYEIVQPFDQLERTVYTVTKEEADTKELARFKNETVNDLTLGSRLLGLGWYRGPVEDAGCFDIYYREDKEAGFGVELHFSGSYVGGGNEDVTIYGAWFYRAGTAEQKSFGYGGAAAEKAYFLRDVPARYFSEIVWQLTKVVL